MKSLPACLRSPCTWALALSSLAMSPVIAGLPFNAAPFGLPLPEGGGLMWEDPREIHRVVVHFRSPPPDPASLKLEYWGSWWPDRHLPKDREPGGGDMGWMELGNWYKYNWRTADAAVTPKGNTVTFLFHPVNAKEYPGAKDYPAAFRYTLKIRVTPRPAMPAIERIDGFTDSQLEPREVKLSWADSSRRRPVFEAFNGTVEKAEKIDSRTWRIRLQAAVNPDPNTFDRTLVTVRQGGEAFTFKVDDLSAEPLYLPHLGVAVLEGNDARDCQALAAAVAAKGAKTLYDRVAALPEQTWPAAWESMPPKKSHICFPLGLDGGRQRFRLDADGGIFFRSNDHYLKARPGQDTPRLELEKPGVTFRFGLPSRPAFRTLQEETLPICVTTWDRNGIQVKQTAFVTPLQGLRPNDPPPPGDTATVFMALMEVTNPGGETKPFALPIQYKTENPTLPLRLDTEGVLWRGQGCRGQLSPDGQPQIDAASLTWTWRLAPRETRHIIVKIPYVVLTNAPEWEALRQLDFTAEIRAAADYWRRRLDASARLISPEPMLSEFYRSHAMHLLVNCEREPDSNRRFARVGSFSYGAYGNESCMMVVDLERRGYHREAQECLDAWLHYQGTVALPGSFASKDGVLYGAGGYEAGGYNQHHGWILWMLAEHYRFTRDEAWLRRAVPGILQGADWIIRETQRTASRPLLERGLLPAGSLEDIGDWWTWLSTSCYSWRGLDNAAWALEQIRHPEAHRIRAAAGAYHQALLANFRQASERSPVVRLRDGTAVPKFPSHVHRRGRCFGWICETLEGAIHLLITRAIDPRSYPAQQILKDYEDNLYLSNQYGYTLDDFDRHWFGRGGISMQACLLLDVEPYLFRDDVKHALRALFNGQAASYFPDVRLNTEHALPDLGDWRGDHFKSSDEANCAGWLRFLFVREEDDSLLLGQAVPRDWLRPGQTCGVQRTATWFGPASVVYQGEPDRITATLNGPRRNPPREIRLRFRDPQERPLKSVTVNGRKWRNVKNDWVILPGNIGDATVVARYGP